MTTRTFYNLNFGFINKDSLGTGYLTQSNYGTVWEIELGCTKSGGLTKYPIDYDFLWGGLESTHVQAVFGQQYWRDVNETFTLTINLLGNYSFPDGILEQLNIRMNYPSDSTSNAVSVDDESPTVSRSTTVTKYIQKQLVNTKKLILSVNPSLVTTSYFSNKKAGVFWVFTRDSSEAISGIPYIEGSPQPTTFSGDDNTTNMTVSGLNPQYETGESATIELTDNTAYHSFDTPYITMGDTSIPFTFTDNKWTLTFNVTDNFTINGTAKRAIKIIYVNVRGCTVNKSDNTFYDITSLPFQIKATPKDRYIWQAGVSIAYCDVGYTGNYRRQQFGFSGEPTHADYAQLRFYSFEDTDVEIKLYLEPDYSYEKLGLIGIYSPTDNQMLELANKRFIDSPASEEFGFIDYSEFIISYRKLYLKRSVITNYIQKTVKYGKYNTGITCDLIPDTIINIPVDTLTIREMYNNVLDYDATTITAYLPFIGFVDLDVQTFMGATTSLTYRVNPITGDCVAIFEASRTQQTTQAAFTGNIGFGIPVHFNGTSYRNNDITDNVWYLMNNLIPYIDIRTQLPYEPVNNIFGGDDNTLAQISTFTGYCRFSKVDLSMGAMTQDEYNEIINILQSGVIV